MANMQGKEVAPVSTDKKDKVFKVYRDMVFPQGSKNSIIPMFDAILSSSTGISTVHGQLLLPAGLLAHVNPLGAPFFLTISEPLSESFAEGWNGLPVELKRYILSFILATKKLIHNGGPTGFKHWATSDSALGHQYYKLLHTNAEIAHLSREIFYQENTFAISVHKGFIYPHAAHQLIRKLFLVVHLSPHAFQGISGVSYIPSESVLAALQRLSHGSLGLDNLQRVDIEFDAGYVKHRSRYWLLDEPIDIPCEGSTQLLVRTQGLLSEEMLESLRGNLEKLFTFKGQKHRTRLLQSSK